jgi:hypothetical protein
MGRIVVTEFIALRLVGETSDREAFALEESRTVGDGVATMVYERAT